MKDRIQQFIDYKNINAGEFAVILEVQRSNISHILNGRNKPSAAFIEKMLIAFPDLSARWLLTGQGEMIEGLASPEDTASSIEPAQQKVTFPPENDPPQVAEQTSNNEKIHTVLPNISNQDVEKVLLLFSDGTFTTYKKR